MHYNFKNDYSEGAHPHILAKLLETNLVQQLGYGEDEYSIQAKSILRQRMSNPQAEIFFLSGGTQTNLTVVSSLLRVHEAVISAATGHIFANETGAIEATGHKVIAVETRDGKLTPEAVQNVLDAHNLKPHVVKPRMVYISNSTEIGTIYSRDELAGLSAFCQSKNLLLYMDGARLGHGLMAGNSDLSLQDVARLTDIFYIGATKNGGLLGEAVVFCKPELAIDFDYVLKQKGALLAKGRLLAIQFLELFKEDLYFELARHANAMAMKISDALRSSGFTFLTQSTTNQIFPVLPKEMIEKLGEKYLFYVWKNIDESSDAIRIITSWATPESVVDELIADLKVFKP